MHSVDTSCLSVRDHVHYSGETEANRFRIVQGGYSYVRGQCLFSASVKQLIYTVNALGQCDSNVLYWTLSTAGAALEL